MTLLQLSHHARSSAARTAIDTQHVHVTATPHPRKVGAVASVSDTSRYADLRALSGLDYDPSSS